MFVILSLAEKYEGVAPLSKSVKSGWYLSQIS